MPALVLTRTRSAIVPRVREAARTSGEIVWNEATFDAGRMLYDGTLLGRAFRAVAKSFQVRAWRELEGGWAARRTGTLHA